MKIITTMLTACVLAATASAQVPDFTPQTPLIGALLHNDMSAAQQLLASGADPNEGHFFGMPPMLLAVLRQDLDLVRLLQAKGADLTVRDRSGSTALMWAAFSETGDAAVVEELLKIGADPAAANSAGETALDWALRRGDTPAAAALRKAGASDKPAMKMAIESRSRCFNRAVCSSAGARDARPATISPCRRWRSALLGSAALRSTRRLRGGKTTQRSHS